MEIFYINAAFQFNTLFNTFWVQLPIDSPLVHRFVAFLLSLSLAAVAIETISTQATLMACRVSHHIPYLVLGGSAVQA
jgi:uncharacterized membrane protein YfhO